MNDGGRWVFDTVGELLPFEEPERYEAVRKRDRFTSDMLERYCQALGIDVFNPAAYGPESVFIESDSIAPPNPIIMTLAETQEFLHIVPGEADSLPG